MNDDILDIDQCAALLRIAPRTLKNRIYAHRDVPPFSRVGHQLLFIRSDVIEWIRSRTVTTPQPAQRRGRGRPTKVEQMARSGGVK